MSVSIFRTGEEGAGANPGRQESKYQNEGGKRATCDEVVRFGFHLAKTTEGDTKQGENDEAKYDRVKIHVVGDKCTGWLAIPSPADATLCSQSRRRVE